MARHDQAVPVRCGPYEGEPHQGRGGQVEAAGAIGGEEGGETVGHLVGSGQVQFLQGYGDLGRDRLHGFVEVLVEEADAQVGVAAEQARDGGAQGGGVDGAVEVEDELRGVDVHGVGVVEGVEVHPGLQRRQREHVLQLEPVHLRPPHLFCSRSIWAWLSETRGRSDGV